MDIDVTFLLQFAILLALMRVLERLLHRPILRTLAAREQQTDGTLKAASQLEQLTAADVATFEDRLRQVRERLHAEREAQREAGRKQGRRIEDAAREQLARARLAARREAEQLEGAALAELAPARARWRTQLLGRALGRAEAS